MDVLLLYNLLVDCCLVRLAVGFTVCLVYCC